jgi:hypothetical protein
MNTRLVAQLFFAVAIWEVFRGTGLAHATTAVREGNVNLAFVLLPTVEIPTGEAIVRAFASFASQQQKICLHARESKTESPSEIVELELNPGGTAFIAAIEVPVPKGEAEGGVRFSVSALGTGWTLPPHKAHLIVTLQKATPPGLASLSCFTSLLAAVAEASHAVGIYWGGAGATHDASFFIATAHEPGIVPRIMLWSGLSVAHESDGRLSLLSLGMKQLDLPDLLLVAPKDAGSDALTTFFDLLAYVAERGEPLPEGDTVGHTAQERLPVRYVPSPVDAKKRVWRVELGGP